MSRLVRTAAAVVVFYGMLLGSPAFAQESMSIVHGTLFVDINGNGLQDAGEPGVPGLELEFANGESILTVATGQDGSYSVDVAPGLWRVSIVALTNLGISDALNTELTVSEDQAAELSLDLPLGPELLVGLTNIDIPSLGSLLGYVDEVVAALEPQVDPSEEEAPAVLEAEPDSSQDTDVYTGEYPTEDELLLLLPESGATVHPAMRVVAGAIGLTSVGLVLMALGWRARQA